MAHAIWKGDISFGLVNIPVALYSAESHKCSVKLHLLDKRDLSRVGFSKVNKNTGEKVPPECLVEGYEYEDNSFVVVSKEELKKVHPTSDQSIEILEFVDRESISPEYYDRPYFLEPVKKGIKGYVLLREVLKRTKKIGIAKVIIRTRQYLAALMVDNNALLLELLRFPCELVEASKFNIPKEKIADLGLHKKEVEVAEELVASMSDKWKPEKYKNEYQGSLLDYIMEKIRLGQSLEAKPTKKTATASKKGEVVDLMALLKKSVEKTKGARKPTSKKRTTARRRR